MKELCAEDKVAKAEMTAMKFNPFAILVPTMLVGEKRFVSGSGTAYTDGYNVTYFNEFVDTLSVPETVYLVLHETGHKFLQHMFTGQGLFAKSPDLANQSADYVVNGWIHKLDPNQKVAKRIEGALFDEKYLGWSIFEVFRDLKKEQEEQPPQGGQGQDKGKGQGQGQGQGQGKGKGQGQQGSGVGNPQPLDDHGWGEASKTLGDSEKADKQRKAIEEAVRQGSMMSKNHVDPNDRKNLVDEATEIRVRWDEVLKEFMVNSMTGMDDQTFETVDKRYIAVDIYGGR